MGHMSSKTDSHSVTQSPCLPRPSHTTPSQAHDPHTDTQTQVPSPQAHVSGPSHRETDNLTHLTQTCALRGNLRVLPGRNSPVCLDAVL